MRYHFAVDGFLALADPVRRDILRALVAHPRRVVDLTEGFEISRPAISRHLSVLLAAGLVTLERRGREHWYALKPGGLAPVRAYLSGLEPGAPVPEEALDALDLEVRRTVRDHRAPTTRRTAANREESA